MKEINLTLTKENELSFEKPEPYITIHIATKEAYEKLVGLIEKDTPAEIELIKLVDFELNYAVNCPVCDQTLSIGNTEKETLSQIDKHCPHCGQALIHSD